MASGTGPTRSATSLRRIDTHQHLIPPRYRARLEELGLDAGGWAMPEWTPERAVEVMDQESIETAILSLSAPGPRVRDHDGDGRELARLVNDFGAELVKDRPDRFGLFATLPLPDVEGALAELAYACDVLHADGVVLLSNANGTYLGDKLYEPLWEELAARRTVVFIHPTEPPGGLLNGMPGPIVDYPFDTTRTAVHLVANGVLRRHRELRVILSHAGGFLPFAASRFSAVAQFNPDLTPQTVQEDLRLFYLDLALSSTPTSLPSVLAWADPSRITYGSDYPFVPSSRQFNDVLDGWDLGEATRTAINRGNAEALFPRLADRSAS